MLDFPETRYARSGELNIAYQVMGDAALDLIFVPGLITQLEFLHEIPRYTEFLRLLAGFARVVAFDKSGQGLSDRAFGVPSLEQRMDDIRAVMDAIGSTRAALLGCSEGAPISVMFAATYPERISHLVLYGGMARYTATPDYPFVRAEEEMAQRVEDMVAHWGTGVFSIKGLLPSQAADPEVVRRFARLERLTFSPGALRAMYRQNMQIDVRSVLPVVRVPTLVLHRRADMVIRPENGRYLASRIPEARYIEYADCGDHLIFAGDIGLPVRAGLHTGEIELRGEDIGGIAVHAAQRVMAQAGPGEVLVSRVVTDLVVGAGLTFSGRGAHDFRGLSGHWEIFAVSAHLQ